MTRICIFANRKGGCGKSTTAINVAHGLVIQGYKVLVVDSDPQAHTTIGLGFKPGMVKVSLADVLADRLAIEEVLLTSHIDGLSLLPASRDLGGFELENTGREGSETLLADHLNNHLGNYDFVIIDPPPTLGLLMISGLIAAREVYIPMPFHFLAMEGLAEMMQVIYSLNTSYNPDLRLAGIIPTFHNKHTRLAREISAEISQTFGQEKLLAAIRNNIKLAEAPAHGQTIFEYARKSIGAFDYTKLAGDIEIL